MLIKHEFFCSIPSWCIFVHGDFLKCTPHGAFLGVDELFGDVSNMIKRLHRMALFLALMIDVVDAR